jgi:hypothetical protein
MQSRRPPPVVKVSRWARGRAIRAQGYPLLRSWTEEREEGVPAEPGLNTDRIC